MTIHRPGRRKIDGVGGSPAPRPGTSPHMSAAPPDPPDPPEPGDPTDAPDPVTRLAATSPEAAALTSEERRAELGRRGLVAALVCGWALAIRGHPVSGDGVAVVGARASDPYGLTVARQLGRDLAEAGLTVISGGAEGCDAAAHVGALEVGGKTVVVLPAGHDHLYPSRHAELFERACERGAVVSPFWPTARVARSRFLTRNRVIAAIARAVIVVRANARSGSLSTAHAAHRLGKPVGAVVGPVGDALSEGCHLLFERGAVPICTHHGLRKWLEAAVGLEGDWRDRRWPVSAVGLPAPWALVEVGARDGPAREAGVGDAHDARDEDGGSAPPGADSRPLIEMLAREPGLDLDAIAVRSGLPIESLVGLLLDLELRGALERMPGGRYRPSGRGV